MLDLHFPASFKPMLLPSPTVIVSTKWQPMANISEASFLSSLPGEEKAPKTLGINFKTSCLTLQSKEALETQEKWDKPFEYKLSQTSIIPLKFNLLNTSAFPEIFTVALYLHDQQHHKKQEWKCWWQVETPACVVPGLAWTEWQECHCLIRFCVDYASYLLVFTSDAHKSRIMQVTDKTLCYNYMWIPWNPHGEESQWTVGYKSSL